MFVQIMGNYQLARLSFSHFPIVTLTCLYILWASINRPVLSYRRFPIVTLIEALGHFPISKIHTKSLKFEKFHPVQHNFHTNLDKNIFRIDALRMCIQIMGKYQQARFE